MSHTLRLLLLAVLTGALGGAILAERCGYLALDLGRLPDDLELLRRARAQDRVLGERDGALWRSITVKEKATQEVIAGRLGLFEAGALFRDLAAATPDYPYYAFRAAYPGNSLEESFCRAVIYFVHFEVAGEPGGPELVNRLEHELRERLRTGPLELPGPSDPGDLRFHSSATDGKAPAAA